jgi:hypothetical protein
MPLCFSRYRSSLRSWLVSVLLGGLLATISAAAAEDDMRFSATLSATQRAEAGLAQLTDDNVAVIDALVRQEETTLRRRGARTLFGSFSQRRSAHEREIAGFARLAPAQLARLDELIAARTSTTLPQLSAAVGTSPLRLQPAERKSPLEIHGAVTLTYGWSNAGSFRGGEMVVNIRDPARPNFSLTLSYAEYRGKGLATPYFDPLYDLPRYRPLDEFELRRRSRELTTFEREP